MAYTTINKSSLHFNTKLYTGNGSTGNAQTGVGFQPDWVWIKDRGSSGDHALHDAVRGATKRLDSNTNDAEATVSEGVQSFDSDGFTVGNAGNYNSSSGTYVAWNWKAGTTSGLSGGTITPTGYSINATSGFGIYKYTGNGTSGATIAHGLGKVPTMIMVKRLDSSPEWQIYNTGMGNGKWIELTTGAQQTGTSRWNDTSPTNTLFYLGNDSDVNYNGGTYVAYVFCNVPGYSKMGSYIGNGSADGTFIYTGFKPAFILTKKSSGSGTGWGIFDNKREGAYFGNPTKAVLQPDTSGAEFNTDRIDVLSNGFKWRYDWNFVNNSGNTYIYMAFGQTLVGSNNTPATAR